MKEDDWLRALQERKMISAEYLAIGVCTKTNKSVLTRHPNSSIAKTNIWTIRLMTDRELHWWES